MPCSARNAAESWLAQRASKMRPLRMHPWWTMAGLAAVVGFTPVAHAADGGAPAAAKGQGDAGTRAAPNGTGPGALPPGHPAIEGGDDDEEALPPGHPATGAPGHGAAGAQRELPE